MLKQPMNWGQELKPASSFANKDLKLYLFKK